MPRLYSMKKVRCPDCARRGHRRMITSAPASAQSAFSWLGVAEREIKTIVPMGLFPGYRDRHKILPGAEPSPFQNPDWKRISNLRLVSYFHQQAPWIGRSRDPDIQMFELSALS